MWSTTRVTMVLRLTRLGAVLTMPMHEPKYLPNVGDTYVASGVRATVVERRWVGEFDEVAIFLQSDGREVEEPDRKTFEFMLAHAGWDDSRSDEWFMH